MMNKTGIIITIIFFSALLNLKGQTSFFGDADSFFKKYVINGKINYDLIKKDPSDLKGLMKQIENFPLTDQIGDKNKAFYINTYNILVINQVIDNYPIGSPQEVPGFFNKTKYPVAGSNYTLNHIENEILRPVYKDPRFHFVLVCGALGCPPITNFAYLPEKLDEQLENQTLLALNDNNFVRIAENKVELSEIFRWYEEDFVEASGNSINYINKYRREAIPQSFNVSFYTYDWALNEFKVESAVKVEEGKSEVSNIFAYTPSKLLKSGQVEMQLFNNLYTQQAYRDGNREKINYNSRDTYFGALFYALYGISKSARVNVGFDLNMKSVFTDASQGSPLGVFRFDKTPNSRTAVTSIGPKVKFQPLNNVSNFSVQSAFWIPVAKDLEAVDSNNEYPWMDYHMYTWWNQFFFDKSLGSDWQIFTEADLMFRFKTKNGNIPTHMDVPLSVFLSWFPSGKVTLYSQLQYSPRFQLAKTTYSDENGNNVNTIDPFDLVSDYAHAGGGLKYQLTSNLNLEASSTYFFTSKNGGAGSTFNLGIRIIL